jgi:hypothetical protein
VPLARWSAADLAAEAVSRGVVSTISAATVGRWLAADAIRPWRHRSWIFPRDPDFAAKAAHALDLYDRIWHGQPLGDDEYVICADEKTQRRALSRCHPDLPPAPARLRRRRLLGRIFVGTAHSCRPWWRRDTLGRPEWSRCHNCPRGPPGHGRTRSRRRRQSRRSAVWTVWRMTR